MAFIVQTPGAAVANANAYETVAEFKAYHDDRGNTYSTFTDPQIEKAIVKATDFIDQNWDFQGLRSFDDQTLEWPRSGVFTRPELLLIDDQSVPSFVKKACSELAFAALTNDLDPNVTGAASESIASKSAGDLSITFGNGGQRTGSPLWRKAEKYLGPYTCALELMRA